MRIYALLLGLALTAGYGYAAQVAVSSASVGGYRGVAAGSRGLAEEPEGIWYGGTLAPVKVEAKGNSPAKTAAARRRLILDGPPVRCSHVNRSVLL
jgi:hypothetical protein